jgi:hypothetical protein
MHDRDLAWRALEVAGQGEHRQMLLAESANDLTSGAVHLSV